MESFTSLSQIAADLRSAKTETETLTVDVPSTVERALPRFGLDFATELDLDPSGPGAFLGRSARAANRDAAIAALESWVGYDKSSAADPFGVQFSRATMAAQLRLDPQRAYIPPTAERHPVALCVADASLPLRAECRIAMDCKGRAKSARHDLTDSRVLRDLARLEESDSSLVATLEKKAKAYKSEIFERALALVKIPVIVQGWVVGHEIVDNARDVANEAAIRWERIAKDALVDASRQTYIAADLSLAEEAVLQELCQDPPSSTERERELARLVAEQKREARADKVALREAQEAPEVIPVETEGSCAEALAAES